MNELQYLEGPGDIDPTKLDDFSAGLHYLATVAKIDPNISTRAALWGPQVLNGPMNGWFSKVKKATKKATKGVTNTVVDYASDIKNQSIGTTLARVSAAVATGGLSEVAFAAKSAASAVPKDLIKKAAAAEVGGETATEQISAAGAHWKAIQEKAKAIAGFKFVGIPVAVALPVVVGGLWWFSRRSGNKKAVAA